MQCGLCASTCPEDAITLEPRLLLADGGKARKQPRVLNEAEPYRCMRCGKPFGTLQAIEAMLGKLAGHSMFQGARGRAAARCAATAASSTSTPIPDEVRITDSDDATPEPRLTFSRRSTSEEIARAEIYGLLAQLFYAPPDAGAATRSCRSR